MTLANDVGNEDGGVPAAALNRRLRVLLSSFACEPHAGSELGVGWGTAIGLAAYHEVCVLTHSDHRKAIESELAARPVRNLSVVYYASPWWIEWLRAAMPQYGYNITYYAWQLGASTLARRLHGQRSFDLVHHVTYVRYWQPTFMWRLRIPLVWGPVGGGEETPVAFLRTFSWRGRIEELARPMIHGLARLDPFLRMTARRSAVCLATTGVTAARIRGLGGTNVYLASACAVPDEDILSLGAVARPVSQGPTVRFLSIGRLLHWKGFHLAIEALMRSGLGSRAEYWIIGDGPEGAQLRKQIDRLRLDGRVQLLGRLPRPETLQRLAGADVVVHPSLHDSGSWSCLEAMAARKPIICLDVGGPGVQVTKEAGIKIAASNPEQTIMQLAEAMIRLASDNELRRQMGEAGRAHVISQYTCGHKIDQQLVYYAEAVERAETGTKEPVGRHGPHPGCLQGSQLTEER